MNQRFRYIDLAKGLGILAIVFMHYEAGVIPGQLNTYLGMFMIPVFFIASGWLMAANRPCDSFHEFFVKRYRSLGYPYLVWSLLILAFDAILWSTHYYSNYFMAREAYKTVILRGIGTLWFLPALFFGNLLWNTIRQKSLWMILLSILLCRGYQILYSSHLSHFSRSAEAPFHSLNNMANAYIGIMVGYYAYKGCCRIPQWGKLPIGIALCLIGFFSANGYCLRILAPYLTPLGVILSFQGMDALRLFSYLEYWGKNSLSLMVTHYSITLVLATLILERGFNLSMEGPVSILCFLLSMPIQYGITELINRRMPYLLKPTK